MQHILKRAAALLLLVLMIAMSAVTAFGEEAGLMIVGSELPEDMTEAPLDMIDDEEGEPLAVRTQRSDLASTGANVIRTGNGKYYNVDKVITD